MDTQPHTGPGSEPRSSLPDNAVEVRGLDKVYAGSGKTPSKHALKHVDLTIPRHSRTGRKLRLKGRGLPGKEPGDFYAVLQIALPRAESDDQKAAYREFASYFDFDPRRDEEG